MNKPSPSRRTLLLRVTVVSLFAGLFAYAAPAEALAQETIRGTVTDASTGDPVAGVMVRVADSSVGTLTDAQGAYALAAAADAVLVFGRIGYRSVERPVSGQSVVNVVLEISAAQLQELVVTGYTTQRRADVTGAVSSVDIESIQRETSSSVLQKLAGNVAGVQVETSGSPGGRSTVRIRGVSSFQNNDPLYIVDGTPVAATYANWLNPNDIESIQVLKDASAASIYGSRASNGVVIIDTKKGGSGALRVDFDAKVGASTAVRGYDDFLILDPMQYMEVVRRSYENAGQDLPSHLYGDPDNPSLPEWVYVGHEVVGSTDQWGRPVEVNREGYAWPVQNSLIMPANRSGTNWWDAVFGTGQVRDMNVRVSGGGATERYNVSFGYFDQDGIAAHNRFQRGTVRLNTQFNLDMLTIGENLNLSLQEHYGGMPFDNVGEGTIVGKNILMQPIVPIRDIGGNYASGKISGLGNNTNPVKVAEADRNNVYRNTRMFGNVYARLDLRDDLALRTDLGFNVGQGSSRDFNPITPENSEPTLVNGISESQSHFTSWTWSNTLTFRESVGGRHNTTVLVGQAASKTTNRFISASMADLTTINPDARYIQDAIGDPATKDVNSLGGYNSLLSFFGKANYNFDQRYYLSFTLRRDGSSRLGPNNRWGTFPAFNAGWRLSEDFLLDNTFFTNVMLRLGWGVTGNQSIASGRHVDHLGGGTGTTFYDIRGTDHDIVQGFTRTRKGNPDLKWEENQSVNLGLDVEFFEGRANLALDVWQRDTDDLLFDPPLPATAGLTAPPIVNIGKMTNRGVDLALGYNGSFGDEGTWRVILNGSHYSNEIVRIDGEQEFFFGPVTTRFATQGVTINQVGDPIGAFYGLAVDGFFQDAEEIDQLDAQARQVTGDPEAVYQDGAAPGRFKFKDVNGDGRVTAEDRTVIGSPHPDFTGGLNLGMAWGNWDIGATLFGTYGNEIFDVQKEFYVFRLFDTNVRRDVLTDSWTEDNPDAKYPRLDVTDEFSHQPSDFYIEDGSYLRLQSLRVGYTVPGGLLPGPGDVRLYVQGENLFTITGYSGLDPALPAISEFSSGMDVRDQARGIDRGVYPTSRTLSLGMSVSF